MVYLEVEVVYLEESDSPDGRSGKHLAITAHGEHHNRGRDHYQIWQEKFDKASKNAPIQIIKIASSFL